VLLNSRTNPSLAALPGEIHLRKREKYIIVYIKRFDKRWKNISSQEKRVYNERSQEGKGWKASMQYINKTTPLRGAIFALFMGKRGVKVVLNHAMELRQSRATQR
jgi:hypothetical protein